MLALFQKTVIGPFLSQKLVFGKFTPQIEEWRGRDLSSFFGNEKLHIFILALFQKTVIGPRPGPMARALGPAPAPAPGPETGPGPWPQAPGPRPRAHPTRSGLEKGSDYGLSQKCQNEDVQFFIAKKLDRSRPRNSSIWGVNGPKTKI